MSDKYEVRMAGVPSDAVIGEDGGIAIAFIKASPSGEISVHWLPELFSRPMPLAVRREIAARLRLHADKIESGELEQDMQRFVGVNNPHNSGRAQ